ncbi:hypothetical protein [Wenyingzhuangia sp. IMCC45467]
MKKSLLLICISLIAFSFTIYNNTDFLKLLEEKLNNYTTKQAPEKVYVQTDKPMYALNEDIWFSAYLVNGVTHQKSTKSKVVYVELINPKDSIVAKKTLYIEDISVAGDIKINEEWKPGKYILRGYTNFMRNDSINNFFQKEIPIYDVLNEDKNVNNEISNQTTQTTNKSETSTSSAPIPELSFYPEGGYLINGIQSKVAFKIKDQKYSEINFTGTLTDQNGTIISEVKTLKFGLGTFSILPEAGKKYHVNANINGKKVNYSLPKPLPKGSVISTTNTGKSILINLTSNKENGLQNNYLIAHQRGELLFKKYLEVNTKTFATQIPTTSLNDGVVNITLFDQEGHPMAERVVFVNNPLNNLKTTIKSDKETYKVREKVTLDLGVKNTKGLNQTSFLSMAVRDLKAFPYNTRSNNIKTYLLLNSDLRGQVEEPGYFFEKENDARRRYMLDLVMMANGWKRFTWQELLYGKEKELQYHAEEGLYISGVTNRLKRPYGPAQTDIRLTFFDKVLAQTPVEKTDSLGRFQFGPYVYPNSMSVFLEARLGNFESKNAKDREVMIMIDSEQESPTIKHTNTISTSDKEKQEANFIKVTKYVEQIKFEYNQKIEQLQAVELDAKRESEAQKRKKEMNRRAEYGDPFDPRARIDVTRLDYVPTSMWELLSLNPRLIDNGNEFVTQRDNAPLAVFLDGMPIDFAVLATINPNQISFYDLLIENSQARLFYNKANMIVMYTKSGKGLPGNKAAERKPGIVDYNAPGFYIARQFAGPDHLNGFDELNPNDLRTTLHWVPRIITTQNHGVRVSFFTSDIRSDYIIEVEGISASGQPIHAIKTFNVE